MAEADLKPGQKAYGDKSTPETMKLREHADTLLVAMKTDRYSWWTHWREISDYLIPRRYKWLITPNQGNRGSPINQRIVDNTGTIALRVLAAGMMSGITSPGRPWFKLSTNNDTLNDNSNVKLWLAECERRMETVFAESNFYTSLATVYGDLGAFGTGVLIIYQDYDDVIRCYNTCAGEYFLQNDDRQDVGIFAREFVLTCKQVAERFGKENCSPTVQQAVDQGGAALTREIIIGHLIEPNDDLVPKAPGMGSMPWREMYWERGTANNTLLRLKGFWEKPFIAPRWDIIGNDAYGRSPGMDALGDLKQLQVEQKRKAQAIDKHVNPPMLADASLKNEPASMIPGGVTYVNGAAQGIGFKPIYEITPDLTGLVQDIETVQARIKATFFNDLFMMISQLDTVRTATEIDARKEEKLIQLGPVLERFENEALDPAINCTFDIMLRGGLFPPIPRELSGQKIKVEYISMLAEAQKAASTASVERLAQFVGNLAGAVPGALDNVDWDEMIDEYADMLGVSPKIIMATAKVQAIRAKRAQETQQQAAMQNSLAAVQGAQGLSQTDVGGGQNALQKIMGGA
ncbi:portal protein [Paraburkholderia phenazinium]|uniref:Bacteriophage head to tail connecting protein n=1 Tax=Paraburkholderia phenazinium TaxID=60549 RepID=A0A1N6KP97_9BURK|nr:portal protein [Paraburkholderia phenazinium]SIO58369.1 Bacteriophage head to tail connecting protein [Paraburkholderia phenazinium]